MTFTDQAKREFPGAVAGHFAFLLPLGFRLAGQSEDFVRYSSPLVTVDFTQDFRDGGIDVELRSPRHGVPMLPLHSLFNWAGVTPIGLQAWRREYTNTAAAWLAQFFQEHCMSLLRGDLRTWAEVDAVTKKLSAEYVLGLDLNRMRGQLVDLWKRREYASMVKVMSPLEEHLLPSEAKKLEIARRNLKK